MKNWTSIKESALPSYLFSLPERAWPTQDDLAKEVARKALRGKYSLTRLTCPTPSGVWKLHAVYLYLTHFVILHSRSFSFTQATPFLHTLHMAHHNLSQTQTMRVISSHGLFFLSPSNPRRSRSYLSLQYSVTNRLPYTSRVFPVPKRNSFHSTEFLTDVHSQ